MVTYENIRDQIDDYLNKLEERRLTQTSFDRIKHLLSGASQDVKNRALNYAVRVAEPEVVLLIINKEGDVNSVIDGRTPMMAAIDPDHNNWRLQRRIIRTLLDRGANPSEIVDEKSIDDVIDSRINILRAKNNKEDDIQLLENIKKMIDKRKDRITGGKRKCTQKKKKKMAKKSRKTKKNRKTKKYRKK